VSASPSRSHPNDCGCCAGLTAETPVSLTNRPGLSAISYRVGTHSRFKESMLAALSGAGLTALKDLRTRADDDFTIALLDAAATMADILTFYQERLANEAFLRTATERRSVLELARLIGYELHPGVAASTALAFTVDDAPGAPRLAIIDAGTRVQSIPGPGEKPQTFETIEKIEARVEWNAIRPRQTQPQPISTGMSSILFKSTPIKLVKGDALLIIAPDSSGHVETKLRRVSDVNEDNVKQQTTVTLIQLPASRTVVLDTPISTGHFIAGNVAFNNDTIQNQVLNQSWNTSDLDSFARLQGFSVDEMYQIIASRYRRRPSAPNTAVFAMRKRATLFGANAPDFKAMAKDTQTAYPAEFDPRHGWDWPVPPFDRSDELYLDQVYKEMKASDWVVVSRPSMRDVITQIKTAEETAAAWFAISGQVTAITLDSGTAGVRPAYMHDLRQMRLYIAPEKLTPADLPDTSEVQRSPIQLDGPVQGLEPGQTIIFSGSRAEADGVTGAEVALISEVTLDAGYTTLKLTHDLQHPYVRNTVRINANIATATHGETVQELLGGGDGSAKFQTFTLRQPPLTYVSAANASGTESTLQLRVNDLLWHETRALYGHGAKDHVYIARRDNEGNTTVQFGDGVTGARLPSGQNNIRAKYRKGIGLEGLVKTGQLSMLLSRPLGIKGVVNPQDATGAQNPEQLGDARTNAPLRVLTLDRVISLIDYENFACSFAGIAKALATWTWDGRSRGVMLTVAGPNGAAVEAGSATYDNLLGAIRAAGDPFVELHVKTYRPAYFRFAGNVKIDADFEADKVLAAVEQALRGNFAFSARSFGQPVMLSAVISVIQAVSGVIAVDVDKLYRSGADVSLQQRLLAELPVLSPDEQLSAAELLTLDAAPLDQLGVMA